MKKNAIVLRIGITACAALLWWGFLYPELSLTPDTYEIILEDGSVQNQEEVIEWDFDSDILKQLLNAERSQIRFRSKILDIVRE
ncbi:hypothetical protein LJC58_02335 [Lachnospiraceae bacterium OttesenSCG-928-D06]|nr:hypothetical protein [Lachnospiraceae bacterium OttesenSCG-928-D06]